MNNPRLPTSKLSSDVRDLLYRIEISSSQRRIAEQPALPERTLRRWCNSDEEFDSARSLACELGIRLLR